MLINGFCSLLQFFHMLGVYQVNWNKCGSWLPPDSQYLHEHLLANWVDSLPLEIATKQGPHAFQLSDLFHLVVSQMEHVRGIPTSVVVDTAVYHLQPSQAPKQYSSFGQLAFGYRISPVTSMNESVQRAGASEVVKITQSNSNEAVGNLTSNTEMLNLISLKIWSVSFACWFTFVGGVLNIFHICKISKDTRALFGKGINTVLTGMRSCFVPFQAK